MISQTIFRPSGVTGANGWTETGTPVGAPQPPNRTLPAPIFDDGTSYAPHNGALGSWIIEKTVFSDVAGPGHLTIPAGTFPSGGGIYADDIVSAIRVNGVDVPFAGLGTGVVGPQSVPVTWLAGANTVRIEVLNTVAGNTSVAGWLQATGVGLPCDCCPTGPAMCANVEVILDGDHTEVFTGGPGVTPVGGAGSAVGLARWSDGDISGGNYTGYTSPGVQLTAVTSPIIELSFTEPHNRVRGLREWNQGGSDLNDADGFASWDVEFFAGATSLATGNMVMGNGGAPFTFLLPGNQELNGVTRVRLSNMRKLNPGSGVSPLVREVRALEVRNVFPCRRSNGTLQWYTDTGDLVPNAEVFTCVPVMNVDPVPLSIPLVTMQETALGDDAGLGERICNVVPAVTSSSGYTVLAGPCYDGSAGADVLNWNGPVSSISMSYESGGNPGAGAALVRFSAPSIGTVQWPANGTKMLPGEVRQLSPFPGGYATITYLSPAGSPAIGAPSQDGGPNIRIGPGAVQAYTPYHFRIDFWAI